MVAEAAEPEAWFKPFRIARATGGRVVRTGRPASRLVVDSREVGPGDCFLALRGERFDGNRFLGDVIRAGGAGAIVDSDFDAAAVPPGVFVVRVPDGGAALRALAAERRETTAARVVAITGSCGKTSTKDMLGQVLSAAMPTVFSPRSFNNHVGVPLTLLAVRRDTAAAVVEIGSNAPGEVLDLSRLVRPHVGIITCVAEAHLSGLGSLGGVAAEKAALFDGMGPDGVAILNGDDGSCRRIAATLERRTVSVRIGREADLFATDVRFHGLGTSFLLQGERPVTLPRLGSHNVYNALLCLAAAQELGVGIEEALATLCALPVSPRRMEHKVFGDVRVFDDTYNMNPASARAALAALAGLETRGRKIVVFGEMLELGERSAAIHAELGADVAAAGVDLLVAVGEGATPIVSGALGAGLPESRIVAVADPGEAQHWLMAMLRPHDLVLCKASRRVGLDRLVDGLGRELGCRMEVGRVAD